MDRMSDKSRRIIFEIEPKGTLKKGVPVSLVSATLLTYQRFAFYLGNSLIDRDPKKRGRFTSQIQRELELFLTEASAGSLAGTLELPEKGPSLFPDFPDFGETVTENMNRFLIGMRDSAPSAVANVVPQPEYREKIILSILPLLPSKDSDYSFSTKIGTNPKIVHLLRPSEEKIRTIIGDIKREENADRDEAVIQVMGIGSFDEKGKLKKLKEIFNYELFEEYDLRPYRVCEISWENRRFVLSNELACEVRKENRVIVIEYEPLRIRAYNYSRDAAIRDFAEIFSMIWDEYVKEPDKNLTGDARDLKIKMKSLVQSIEKS